MKESFRIEVDPRSFETSEAGIVTGRLRFSIDDDYFPDALWNDFVVVVLGWWCSAVLDLQRHESPHECELRFMDGPFRVRVQRDEGPRRVTMDFLRNGQRIREHGVPTTTGDLRHQVLEASAQVLSYCQERDVTGLDVENLRKRMSELSE